MNTIVSNSRQKVAEGCAWLTMGLDAGSCVDEAERARLPFPFVVAPFPFAAAARAAPFMAPSGTSLSLSSLSTTRGAIVSDQTG